MYIIYKFNKINWANRQILYLLFTFFFIAMSMKTPDPSQIRGRSYVDIMKEQKLKKDQVL